MSGNSIAILLAAKATILLGLAWSASWALQGGNPRRRIVLWRSTAVGLGLALALSLAPPVVIWRVAGAEPGVEPSRRPIEPTPTPTPTRLSAVETPVVVAKGVGRVSDPSPSMVGPVVPSVESGDWSASASSKPGGAAPRLPGGSNFGNSLLVVWLAGVVVMGARWVVGVCRLAGVVRRSQEAPGWVLGECRAVADRLGVLATVRVVRSSEVRVPCLAGWPSLVLLMPDRQCLDSERSDLRAILAHELAHVRGRDLAWNDALHLLSISLWFHPLAWRVRQAHAGACDAVSDAVAADLLGDVASYSRTLARLALVAAKQPPTLGLAMARKSDVRRRIESLQRRLSSSPLPWRFTMPSIVAVGILTALVGGFGFAPKDEIALGTIAQTTPTPPSSGRLIVQVTEAATEQPLEGVQVAYRFRRDGKSSSGQSNTNRSGASTIDYNPNVEIEGFTLTIRKSGYTPAHVFLDGTKHPLVIPPVKAFRLEKGMTIGGVVTDQAGKPIEGAGVSLAMPPAGSEQGSYHFPIGTPKTDAQGRWRIDEAPVDLSRMLVGVEHPKFLQTSGRVASGLDTITAILTKGSTVKGRVVDLAGKPIKGAKAVLGHDKSWIKNPEATTDDQGKFALENCKPGPSLITIQAEGFSPRFQEVRVEETGETGPVHFTLGPALVIRVRVVDFQGKPVAGAQIAADTWGGHRSLNYRATTDAEGRVEWKSAPKDAVQFDIFKSHFMRRRLHPITASGDEQVVVLHPELAVSGRAIDAKTGMPIPEFSIIRGMTFDGGGGISWLSEESIKFSDGRFTETFDMPMNKWYLRVEAPGYKPAESRGFGSDEGAQSQNFALERSDGLSGVVLLPNGKPAAGADVVLAPRGVYVSLRGASFGANSNYAIKKTDLNGRFEFAKPNNDFLFLAASDAGFVETTADEFEKSGRLTLAPWGRVEGRVLIGGKPGANQPVSINLKRPDRDGVNVDLHLESELRTDSEGRFAFDKVIPGPAEVFRVVVTEFLGGTSSHMPCWQTPVEVKAGATTEVIIGGKGRAVVGQVVIDGPPSRPVDWRQSSPAEITFVSGIPGQGPRLGDRRYNSPLDQDGRFRVDDVPPGEYDITIPVTLPADPNTIGPGTEIGHASLRFTVPGGEESVPIDLGPITAKRTRP